MTRNAVVLLSGGLDSTTVLAIAKDQGFEPYALSFRYGQRHAIELAAAKRVAEAAGVKRHVVCDIDLRVFGGSALTSDLAVPKHGSADEISADAIPITYVPARNTVFLSFALAYAEVIGSTDKTAAYAADRPIHYRDVLATIYQNLGIDSQNYIRDATDRPVRILPEDARPIRELSPRASS